METATHSWTPSAGWSGPLGGLDSEATILVAFGDAGLRDRVEPIAELVGAYPRSHVVGCSTSGQFLDTSLSDGTLVVGVARFASTIVTSMCVPIASADDSFRAGRDLARGVASENLRALFVVSDGLCVNGSELARGIRSVVSDDVVVTGGLAGDGDRFGSTWLLVDGLPQSGFVSAVGLSGDALRVGHGSRGGWDKFGPERLVTRSKANVLFELDGRPALEIYCSYLGDLADGLPATALLFPLALRDDCDDEVQLVRTVLAVDESAQSMTFAGDVPEGCLAQLMHANFDRLVDGAGAAAGAAVDMMPTTDGATLAIAVSCIGRRLVLGERVEDEIEAVYDCLPALSRQIGFYSYGELSPAGGGPCELHNQTMTLTTISEG
ncbi:MAG: FIST signal transduction protein [Acidimicrobiia bacterium]